MSDDRDDVSDRLASRFDDDDDSDEQKLDLGLSGGGSTSDKKAKNVKKEWNAKSIYLPDDLDDDLSKEFKRLDLELDDELELKKTRHFYPLVVQAGLERIEQMERNELLERIEQSD